MVPLAAPFVDVYAIRIKSPSAMLARDQLPQMRLPAGLGRRRHVDLNRVSCFWITCSQICMRTSGFIQLIQQLSIADHNVTLSRSTKIISSI